MQNTSQSEKPIHAVQEADPAISRPTRREFGRLALGFVGAAVTGVLGSCKKESESAPATPHIASTPAKQSEKLKPPSASEKLSAPEIEVNPSIRIPAFSFSDVPAKLEKPKNLDMSEEEFDQFSKFFVEQVIKKGAKEFLMPQLKNAKSPQERTKIIMDFISQTAGMIERSDPRMAKEMDQFHTSWDQEIGSMVAHINTYINRGGMHWIVVWDGKNADLEMFEIGKAGSVKINDGKKEQIFTTLYLGNPLGISSALSDPKNGVGAEWNPSDPKRFMIYDMRMKTIGESFLQHGRGSHLVPPGQEEVIPQQAWEDALRHEASHIYMGTEFPKSGRNAKMNAALRLPLVIKRDGKPYIDLRGDYAPVFFHEIGGVGIQMARSEMQNPIHLIVYCRAEQEFSPSYRLLTLILPLAILQVAPESSMRQELLKDLDTGSTMDHQKLRDLVAKTMTGAHQRQVGELLFRFAMGVFRNAEKVSE